MFVFIGKYAIAIDQIKQIYPYSDILSQDAEGIILELFNIKIILKDSTEINIPFPDKASCDEEIKAIREDLKRLTGQLKCI